MSRYRSESPRHPRLHPQDKNRLEAAELLRRVEEEGAYAQIVTAAEGGEAKAKVREYVSGVTRWRRWLDFLLVTYYTGTWDQVEPELRQILRIGAYDLVILGTPPHVAVSAAVAVARQAVGAGAGQLANALLRRVAEARDRPPMPETDEPGEKEAIRWSHPTWMARRLIAQFGREGAVALMKRNNERPWYGIRANPFFPDASNAATLVERAGARWRETLLPDFVEVERLGPLVQEGLLESGAMAVQDVGAALAVRLLDPKPGETIADACAAPGGKSTYAACLMENRGRIIAIDRNVARLRLVRRACGRQRIRIVETIASPFEDVVEGTIPAPDRILVDAPCSGLGVLARRPDLRWRKEEEDIAALTLLQDRLLDRAAALLRPGGVLVYSTCTITAEENEDRAVAFLSRPPGVVREHAQPWLPPAVVNEDGALETFPHRHGVDGAFAVRFRRSD